jgi:hypothetical protein
MELIPLQGQTFVGVGQSLKEQEKSLNLLQKGTVQAFFCHVSVGLGL